jgi:hypothetical protein
MRKYAMSLEDPINLLLLAPDYIPVIVPCLLPLSARKSIIYGVLEGGLKLDICAESKSAYGGLG